MKINWVLLFAFASSACIIQPQPGGPPRAAYGAQQQPPPPPPSAESSPPPQQQPESSPPPAEEGVAQAHGAHVLVRMPTVKDTNLSPDEIKRTLRAAGLTSPIQMTPDDPSVPLAQQTPCDQSPSGGQQVYSDTRIEITYCYARPTVDDKRPRLEGLAVDEAKRRILEIVRRQDPNQDAVYRIDVGHLSGNDRDPNCKPDTVCRIEPLRWYMGGQRNIWIFVNAD